METVYYAFNKTLITFQLGKEQCVLMVKKSFIMQLLRIKYHFHIQAMPSGDSMDINKLLVTHLLTTKYSDTNINKSFTMHLI